MGTELRIEDHVTGLVRAGQVLAEQSGRAGLDAPVPTCPGWAVRDLLAHQGMVHRWAAEALRGRRAADTLAWESEGLASADPVGWFRQGHDDVCAAARESSDDVPRKAFLADAPAPRQFWARRQCHETTIHAVDAVAAAVGRRPTVADVRSAGLLGAAVPGLAVDGVDEMVTGFVPRASMDVHVEPGRRLVIRAKDTGRAWALRFTPDQPPAAAPPEPRSHTDWTMTADPADLYLALWNRGGEVTCDPPELTSWWRENVLITWG